MSYRHTVRVKQGRIIPLWLRLILTVVLFCGMLLANFYLEEDLAILCSILFAMPIFPIWNAYYLLEVDNKVKAYLNGYWAAGITWGKWKSYREINEIIILGPESRKPKNRRSGKKAFEAYLSTDDGTKVYLLGNESKSKLKDRMKILYEKLQSSSYDKTSKHIE